MTQPIYYDRMCKYFDNPLLTKQQDTDTHSVYITQITSLLSNTHRYILVFTPRDVFFKGYVTRLDTLKWTSLHTRSLPVKYNVNKTTYRPKQILPYTEPIHLVSRDNEKTIYKCSTLPLKVTLLHEEYDLVQYASTGNLSAALETYNTIIELI